MKLKVIGNQDTFSIGWGGHDNLVEECVFWGGGRYKAMGRAMMRGRIVFQQIQIEKNTPRWQEHQLKMRTFGWEINQELVGISLQVVL